MNVQPGAPRKLTTEEWDRYMEVRYSTLVDSPYLVHCIMTLDILAVEGLGPHMGLDGKGKVYIDPAHLMSGTTKGLTTDLVHVMYHWLHDHGRRGESRELVIWATAADLAVNAALMQDGYILQDDALTPGLFNLPPHLLAEEYYDLLADQMLQGAVGQMQPGVGGPDGDGDGSASGGDPTMDDLAEALQSMLDELGKVSSCPGGSGVNGRVQEWEDSTDTLFEGISTPRQDAMRDIVADAVEEHAARGIGNTPAHLRRWAEKRKGPVKTPWHLLLRQSISRTLQRVAGMVDYSMQRPSRRNTDSGMYLPGMRGRKCLAAIAVDTSGSMGAKELGIALREIDGALMTGAAEVHGFAVDAASTTPVKMRQLRDLDLVGGGGTDMGVAIRTIQEDKHKYDLLVIITDCMTPWPKEAPDFTVVVVGVGIRKDDRAGVPEWATLIHAVD